MSDIITNKLNSKIGFGTWGFAGNVYGQISNEEAEELVHLAISNNINFFDTSSLYGLGKSERILGKATKNLRENVIFTTKGGLKYKSRFEEYQDFSENFLIQSLNESLSNLNTNYIDIYLLHSPELRLLDKQVFKVLEKLKYENLILEYGVSVKSPEDASYIIEEYGVKLIETNFSLIDQRVKDYDLFNKYKDVKIISRTPLNYGFLTDSDFSNLIFEKEVDHRFRFGKEQLKLWNDALDKFKDEYTKFKSSNKNITKSQFSLNFCISHPQVLATIPGMMRKKEVLENSKTINYEEFDDKLIENLYQIYSKNIFFKKS